MMKACVLKDVSTFEVKEVERPTLMEDDEVLLKVTACSICGSDLRCARTLPTSGASSVTSCAAW